MGKMTKSQVKNNVKTGLIEVVDPFTDKQKDTHFSNGNNVISENLNVMSAASFWFFSFHKIASFGF